MNSSNQTMRWASDCEPSQAEGHTKTKLNLLRAYLRAYFDRLNKVRRDVFKLTLVDGFAGGGMFVHKGETIQGSPLVMLEEGEEAERRLNMDRRNPIRFELKYRFVEKKKKHCACLTKTLENAGYHVSNDMISVQNKAFEDVAGDIIDEIKTDQPRAGRAIFLLDQTGYKQVALEVMRDILNQLPHSEIILTFAMDMLVNFMGHNKQLLKAYRPLELSEGRVNEIIHARDGEGNSGKALAQRFILRHILDKLRPHHLFVTPFVLNPTSRRALWFIHFSRHPTARNVMVERHWDHAGLCGHYGPGSLRILGYDSLISGHPELFDFKEIELAELKNDLLNQLPDTLYNLASDAPITVDAFFRAIANDTGARYKEINEVICQLHGEREINVLNSNNKKRSISMKNLRATDLITVPQTLLLPGISRRKNK